MGSCKSCGKGLVCRGRCEADVTAVIELVERNIKLQMMSVDSNLPPTL